MGSLVCLVFLGSFGVLGVLWCSVLWCGGVVTTGCCRSVVQRGVVPVEGVETYRVKVDGPKVGQLCGVWVCERGSNKGGL